MKNFNIFGVHRNIQFLGGRRLHEKPMCREDYLKRGELGQFADLSGGVGKKEGVVILRGIDTPMHTMAFNCQKLSQT